MKATNMISSITIKSLEFSEIAYWSKYYDSNASIKSMYTNIGGAFVGTTPENDILAMNRVIGMGLKQKMQLTDLDAILRFYKKAGAGRFILQLCPNIIDPNDKQRLVNHGFKHYNNWAKLYKKAELSQPVSNSSIKVVTINKNDAKIYGEILFKCFDWQDDRLVDWLASIVGKQGYTNYLAYLDNTPIAAAAIHDDSNIASMCFAGTLQEFRGMGAQNLLIQKRILHAMKKGCTHLVAETAWKTSGKQVASYRNLTKMGFEKMYLLENWLYEF